MPVSDVFISVIAPLRDDADLVEAFTDEVMGVLRANFANYELVLVDDGSRDATAAAVDRLLVRHECLRLLRLSRQFGAEAAISAGLDSVIGDFVVVMEPERDPAALIPEFVKRARAGSGVVYGVCHDRSGQGLLVRTGTALFYRLAPALLGLELTPDATLFRVLSRQAVNAITGIKDRYRFFRLLSASVGFRSEALAYEPQLRRANRRHKSFGEAFDLALGLAFTNSMRPLRLAGGLALLAALGNVLYLAYSVAIYLFKPDVAAGWTSQSIHAAAMFAVLFLILAICTEYLGHILQESRERPLYILLDEKQSTVMIADEARRNVVSDSAPDGTAGESTPR